MASSHRSARTSASALRVAAYPSLNTRYTTARTPASRSGSVPGAGTSNRMPASRILRLARTSRWAMVGSGSRNAAAISRVVSPAA